VEVVLSVLAGSLTLNLMVFLATCVKGCKQQDGQEILPEVIQMARPDPVISFPPPPRSERSEERLVMEPLPSPPPLPIGPPPTAEEEEKGLGVVRTKPTKPIRGVVRVTVPGKEGKVYFVSS
jgi:hypothetical protein